VGASVSNTTSGHERNARAVEAANFLQTPGEEAAETKDPPLQQAENTIEATRRTSPDLERRSKSFSAENTIHTKNVGSDKKDPRRRG